MQPTGSYCPSDEKVSQIRIQVPLPVPDGCNSAAYFADLKQTFLQSYDEDIFFQMSMQGIGTPTWWLRGNVRLKERVHLKSTRKRVKRIMVSSCHSRHVLDPDLNTKFGDYLARELKVTSDTEQLSGESHWWTSWSLREQSSTLAAVPASAFSGPRTVDVVPGPATLSAGAPGAPAWAFNRARHSGGPHTCTGCCCPPGASSSGASPDYAAPPSMYPGVESSPYCLLSSGIPGRDAVRGGRSLGGGLHLGAGNGDHRGSASGGAAGRISADQGGGSGLGAPALPATPRSGSLGTGRPRSTPPAATESPASKRARPGEAIAWSWWASVARVVQFDNATFV